MPRKKWPRKIVLNADAVWEEMCRKNLSHGELAELLGISPGYLSQLLSGQRSPSANVRKLLLNVFDVKFDDIFLFVENV